MKTALHAWMLQISIARCVTPKHTYLVLDSVLDRVPMGTRKIKFIIFVILTQRSSLNLNWCSTTWTSIALQGNIPSLKAAFARVVTQAAKHAKEEALQSAPLANLESTW